MSEKQIMTEPVPAMVLGAGINGLGVARSLAQARVAVWLLDSDLRRPEMRTRTAKPVAIRALSGEALIQSLWELGETVFQRQRPVLILTQEESVRTVSAQREALLQYYRFTLPDKSMVESLLHKEGFQCVAERLGAPIPPLVHVRSVSDLPALRTINFPVVVKPGGRDAGYSRMFSKAYRVANLEEAEHLIRRILPVMPDVVVQEWIEGPDSNIYFCLQHLGKDGSLTASFTGRKIRSWPPQVGGTASCTAAPEAAGELEEMTTGFFKRTGVAGLAGMEYKRDTRSAAFRMVEPTIGRTDYQEEVATLNGVNLPYAAYCAELGLPVRQPAVLKRPVVWRDRTADVQSALAQGQQVKGGMPQRSHVANALWRWGDPLPFLFNETRRLRRALKIRVRRMLGVSQAAGGD